MRRSKPSSTARKVALNVVALGGDPELEGVLPPGIVDATAELLLASGVAGKMVLRVAGSRRMLRVYKSFDFLMPGQLAAFAHRKAFFERQVRVGIGAGATQVLVLGAGYDTLGYRLAPQFSSVSFLEIDHPSTARVKARGIERLGKPSNLQLLAADLGERPLTEVLESSECWDTRAPSVILAEALLMYLRPSAARRLFERCAAAAGKGSRMCFSYVGSRDDGSPDAGPWTKLVLGSLAAGGEPWLWSSRPGDVPAFLEGTGWTLRPETAGDVCHGVEYFGVAVR